MPLVEYCSEVREKNLVVRQREFAERLQERSSASAVCSARYIFLAFSRSRQRGGIWCHMINLVYGVCCSPFQPFRGELGHSKCIYRKGVSPEGGDDWQVMEVYYWSFVIVVADLCVFFKQIAELRAP